MNKLMIALGIAIIMGISFAAPSNWMEWTSHRYYCSWDYNSFGQWYYIVDYYGFEDPDYEMYYLAMPGGELYYDWYYMQMYAGYPTQFRSWMSAYNSDYSAFKLLFNTALRGYLAEYPEDSSDILAILLGLKSDYYSCISP